MFKNYVITLFLLLNPINSHAQITFTNKCEKEVIKLINNSQNSIDIAVYSINNLNIINQLIKAKDRNVKIRILTDSIQAFGKSSKVKLLHDAGFDIKIHSKDRIMHHKFAIFDNQKAIEGSFNWTYSAANKNAEDCNIFDSEKDVNTLKKRFKKLWKINEKDISECYFDNMKLDKEERNSCTLKNNKK
ncbi:phospholipase D-like domain-containing protein [Candidatus Deianiraea vastatrix]|uniref:Phospholipase D n=1 Tax=Candidatus Deianiraea vastatrix TaxID=2163644 RepID=A0A5B8XF98_9RICK|nr:phospholipase D-like domain-containing protein [Candidatus Deianiraea vastatrix]QED23021.1 Putative phospholipase D-like protein [Candidatus Deianiraea vastatrix]